MASSSEASMALEPSLRGMRYFVKTVNRTTLPSASSVA